MIDKPLIEATLKTLGSISDVSEYISKEYRKKMPYSYLIFQDKYNDSTDDSVCVEVYSDGTFIVSNDDLPYGCYSQKEVEQLKDLFDSTVFDLECFERKEPVYYVSVSVKAKAFNLDEVVELVNEFRSYNDVFLKNKVVAKTGDSGIVYLFRKDA